MRRFVLGDVHGRFEALVEVLKASGFDYAVDQLILLGDLVDGGYNTYEVVEELLKIKNVVFVLGNHDEFFLNHIRSGFQGEIWLSQGGLNTVRSYNGLVTSEEHIGGNISVISRDCLIPITHQEFFNKAIPFYVAESVSLDLVHDCDKCHGKIVGIGINALGQSVCSYCGERVDYTLPLLFVHGGFDARHGKTPYNSTLHELVWDRDLIEFAMEGNIIKGFSEVFVGHTPTQAYDMDFPVHFRNLWMLDTGAGWDGFLTILDVDSKRFWQSRRQVRAGR